MRRKKLKCVNMSVRGNARLYCTLHSSLDVDPEQAKMYAVYMASLRPDAAAPVCGPQIQWGSWENEFSVSQVVWLAASFGGRGGGEGHGIGEAY